MARELWLEQMTIEELFELYHHETKRINKDDMKITQDAIKMEIIARLAQTYRALEEKSDVDVHKIYKTAFVQPALKSPDDPAWKE